MKKFLLGISLLGVITSFSGCLGQGSEYIGKWEAAKGNKGLILTLKKDNTCEMQVKRRNKIIDSTNDCKWNEESKTIKTVSDKVFFRLENGKLYVFGKNKKGKEKDGMFFTKIK